MKSYHWLKQSIAWILIFCLVLPLQSGVVFAEDSPATTTQAERSSQAEVRSKSKSELLFSQLSHQHFVLVEPPSHGRGFVSGLKKLGYSVARKFGQVMGLSSALVENRIDYDRQPAELAYRFGLSVKRPEELIVGTAKGEDGKAKLQILFKRDKNKFSGSRAVIDPEHFNILSVDQDENRALALNSDGSVYALDKAMTQRIFGAQRVRIYKVGQIDPSLLQADKTLSILIDRGPFVRGEIPLSDTLRQKISGQRIKDGSVFVVSKSADGRTELVDFIDIQSILREMVAQEAGLAVSLTEHKAEMIVDFGRLEGELQQFLAAEKDFKSVASSPEAVKVLQSFEPDEAQKALGSVAKQLEDLAVNPAHSLEDWLNASTLGLSSASKAILVESLSSKNTSLGRLLSETLNQWLEEIQRQQGAGLGSPELQQQLSQLEALIRSTSGEQNSDAIIRALSAGFEGLRSNGFDPLAWAMGSQMPAMNVALVQASIDVLDGNHWDPSEALVMGALLELSQKLDVYIERNHLHPLMQQLKSLAASLKRLKLVSSGDDIQKKLSELEGFTTSDFKLLDLVAEAHLDQQSGFGAYVKQLDGIHPDAQSRREKWNRMKEKVASSRFMKMMKNFQETFITLPDLLLAGAVSYVLLGKPFTPEYREDLLFGMGAYYGILVLLRIGFSAIAKIKYPGKGGAYAMSAIGNSIYTGFLANPPLVRLWDFLGQKNALFAAKHGYRPSIDNGGIIPAYVPPKKQGRDGDTTVDVNRDQRLAAEKKLAVEAESKLVAQVRAKEALRAFCRKEAVKAVLRQAGIDVEDDADIVTLLGRWSKKLTSDVAERLKQLEQQVIDADLSADPQRIIVTAGEVAKHGFEISRDAEFARQQIQKKIAIVYDQLVQHSSHISNQKLEEVKPAIVSFARQAAAEIAPSNKTQLWIAGLFASLRGLIRDRSSQLLIYPFLLYKSASRAVPDPNVAAVTQSGAYADLKIQLILDPLWNGEPFKAAFHHFGMDKFPTRSDPNQPEELFAQPGSFLRVHPDENASLIYQIAVHMIAAPGRNMVELGSGTNHKNEYDVHANPPADERYQSYWASVRDFFRVKVLGVRGINASGYFWMRFMNHFRFFLPNLWLQMGTTYLMTGKSVVQLLVQYVFMRGTADWAFAWPWLWLARGPAIQGKLLGAEREAFKLIKRKFLESVDSKDFELARLQLPLLNAAYELRNKKFEPLSNLQGRNIFEISELDLRAVASFLKSSPSPVEAEINPNWADTVGLVGGIATTALAIPYMIVVLNSGASGLPVTNKLMLGALGLSLYPVLVGGLNLYDLVMKSRFDPRMKEKDARRVMSKLLAPERYSFELSGRLARAKAEEKARILSGPAATQAEALIALDKKYEEALARLNKFAVALKQQGASPGNDKDQGGTPQGPCPEVIQKLGWTGLPPPY